MGLSTLHKLVLERCSADHKRAGVELDKDPVGFEEAANRRRSLGRHTIEEAALFIAIEGPANYRRALACGKSGADPLVSWVTIMP